MEDILLTNEQQNAIDICVKRYKDGQKITVINAPAGCGKTTIVPYIIKALNLTTEKEEYVYASFTGQAVRMLRKKGCVPAMTLHHMLYEMRPKADGTFYKIKRKTLPYKVIIIDEISMVAADLLNDVMAYGVYIIALGDNAQLPPIKKNEDNHLLDAPHITLTKIFRQKDGSGILDLATYIRTGGNLEQLQQFDNGNDVKIINKNDLSIGMLTWANQVICSTNRIRDDLNHQIRIYLNNNSETTQPIENDKIVICRNYWDRSSEGDITEPLTNGMTGYIHNLSIQEIMMPTYPKQKKFKYLIADFEDELGNIWPQLNFDYQMFDKGDTTLNWKENMQIYKKSPMLIPIEGLYGNVISVHKSQGNQFEKVTIIMEDWPKIEKEKRASLYTAVTRASQKVVLILNK